MKKGNNEKNSDDQSVEKALKSQAEIQAKEEDSTLQMLIT